MTDSPERQQQIAAFAKLDELMRIGDDRTLVDLQPCGGTHVARTSEIGHISVVKIENKGKQNRRIIIAPA